MQFQNPNFRSVDFAVKIKCLIILSSTSIFQSLQSLILFRARGFFQSKKIVHYCLGQSRILTQQPIGGNGIDPKKTEGPITKKGPRFEYHEILEFFFQVYLRLLRIQLRFLRHLRLFLRFLIFFSDFSQKQNDDIRIFVEAQ